MTVFNHDNNSQEVSLTSLDLHLVTGYILEETFASTSGFILDGHFYGTVFLKDAVHFLEPMGRESRDMHIFGDGLKTLLRRSEMIQPPMQRVFSLFFGKHLSRVGPFYAETFDTK